MISDDPHGILSAAIMPAAVVHSLPIAVPQQPLAEFCLRHQIRKLSLFGSVLTPRFNVSSDIDVLVEYEPGALITLLDMSRMERELSELFGRKVDLRTAADLSRYFRDEVLKSALVQYERV